MHGESYVLNIILYLPPSLPLLPPSPLPLPPPLVLISSVSGVAPALVVCVLPVYPLVVNINNITLNCINNNILITINNINNNNMYV